MSAPGLKDRMPIYEELRDQLPSQLPGYLVKQRWFGSKAKGIRSASIVDLVPFTDAGSEAIGLFARVEYDSDSAETYVLPLVYTRTAQLTDGENDPAVLKIHLDNDLQEWMLIDALRDENFLRSLLRAVEQNSVMRGVHGEIRASQTGNFLKSGSFPQGISPAKVLKGEQSNSSVIYGDRFILKIFRRLVEGLNPDLEIGLFLTQAVHFHNTPPLAGWFEYQASEGKSATLAILQGFVPNKGDAWNLTLQNLSRFWREISQTIDASLAQSEGKPTAGALVEKDISCASQKSVVEYLNAVKLLAKRTAQLHLALASNASDPNFAPEPFTEPFRRQLEASVTELTQRNLALLRNKEHELPPEARGDAQRVLARQVELLGRVHRALSGEIHAARTRIHGDYHLGQVLFTGFDFIIIDFEGEPARTLIERRSKRPPLQDVAGMLRSFHYAVYTSLLDYAGSTPQAGKNMPRLRAVAEEWYAIISSAFIAEYLQESKSASYLPSGRSEISKLIEFHLLEKAIYELGYELNNRPTWVGIPLSGIGALLDS